MRKLIFVVLLLAVVWAVPALRERAAHAATPVLERMGPFGESMLAPARRFGAKNRLEFYGRIMASERSEGRALPESRTFQAWLTRRARGETGVDPWGQPYWLQREPGAETFVLGSNGPDGLRGTDDDVTHTVRF